MLGRLVGWIGIVGWGKNRMCVLGEATLAETPSGGAGRPAVRDCRQAE